MSTTKCTTPFQLSPCLEYGFTITGRDVKKVVSCVQCNFCVYDGRSGDDVSRKRTRTKSIYLFMPPYRPHLYCKHLKKQHAEGWLKYQGLFKVEKQMFFNRQKMTTINWFFCMANDVLEMTIVSKITTTIIEQHCVRTKNLKLMGLNDHMVSQFIHIMSQPRVFAFSIACDGSTHYESSYFDIRIRVGINGVLHNLHLVIVPFYGCHTTVHILALIVKILDVLFLMWRDKLNSVSNDGDNTMTGRHGGFVTLLEKEVTNNILRKVTKAMMDGLFYKIAHAFLMDGAKCPKDTMWWVDLVMFRQMAEIKVFVNNICIDISIYHDNMDTSYTELDQNTYIKVDECALSTEDQDAAIHNIAVFSITLVNELCQIQAERDSNNEAAMMEVFWSPNKIEDVERDHMKLVKDYGVEIELKQNIDAQDHMTMFNCAWDSMRGRYQALRCFSSYLVTSFTNTTLVNSNFSILKWEKNSN
ncbi:hypothetical protein CY35_02G035500 [Sphagnum magellanicum]|nr:hypothetical protein CY35_02G035500 [Sphagnum magellanicum]